ncbi:Ig-like domain-containing protein [Pontibacter ramchanderi]|uniref:Ig-like domain-containing protein n=1 Tax=Pontibacter ramchanderi TaxID=1179743 RepID=UPI0015D58AFE|nr:Ig-like domain-containing protein [Pontibacter ramchanderi]
MNIGGVEYELTQTGNGSWENRGNGGASNSASLHYSTAADSYITIKRKDSQKFKFYGLWMSYGCYSSPPYYVPPHLKVTYHESNLPQDAFNEANQAGLVLSKNVEVRSVTLNFSGLHTLYLDNLVIGPVGTALSSNANLSNLTLSGTTLSPVFSANTVNYTASVANAVASVTVTPTKADANATVSINGTVLASGVTSRAVNLNVGANTITTVVTAQNGTTSKAYTVNVTRAAPIVSPPPVAGYVNALQFDGVNDYVEISSQPSNQFDSETEFTVSLWFKANSMSRAGLFSRPSGGGDMQFWLSAENGTFTYGIDKHGTGWTWLSTGTAYKLGEWVQVTTVRRNVGGERRMEIYANGVLIGSDRVNYTSSASNASIRIGTVINADESFANGQIDNVSLWKKALTAEEIKTLGATTLNGNEAGLAGYWRFDETSGTTAYDATANANHGTLRNMDLATARVRSTAGDIITKKNVAYAGKLTGSDPEGKPLSYSLVTGPSIGTLVLNANGTFTYTPNTNAVGADNFSYRVSNGTTTSNTATINVTIVELAAPSVPDLLSSSDTGISNSDNITNDNTPTFSGTATPGYTVTLYSGGSAVGIARADDSGKWTITTSSLADGAHSMTAIAVDGTGSQSPASAALTVVIDTTAPNTTITASPAAATNATSATFTFTSNETVSTFQASVDGSPFTIATSPITLTGLSGGTHTVQIRAMDAAGNLDPTPASYTWTVDATAPAVTGITRHNPATATTNVTSVTFLVSFSEGVTSVDADDFSLATTGGVTGTVSGVSGAGTRYEITVSNIIGSGTLRLDVMASGTGITDEVGNGLSGGYTAGQTYTIDTTRPVITSVSVPANGAYSAGQQLDFTVNFSEAVTVATENGTPTLGLTIGAASRQAVYVSGSGTSALTFRYTVQPGEIDTDGIALAVGITLNGGTITDAIGNAAVLSLNGVASTAGVLVDAVAPTLQTVTIASSNSDATKAKVGDVVTLRLEASELIAQPTVVIAGKTAPIMAVSGTTYTATYTLTAADAEGMVPFTINFNDLAGNVGTAVSATTNSSSVTFDKTAPTGTLAINGGATHTAATEVTLSNSATDALTGVADMRFSNDNTTWSAWMPFAASQAWTLPAVNGNRQVYTQLRDGAGNIGTAEAQIILDNVPLTLTLTSDVQAATNKPFDVTLTFSKAATGFTIADLTVVNATASNLVTADNKVYTATITPTSEGEIRVSVAAGVAVDVAGNLNAASNTITTLYDTTRPAVVVSTSASSPVNSAFTVTLEFSENVSGLAATGIAVSNGTLSQFSQVDGRRYSALVTPAAAGEVTVQVPANAAADAAANGNLPSNTLAVVYDADRPTVVLASTAPNPINRSFQVSVRFSEPVTGFTAQDITVVNATLSGLTTTDNQQYTVEVSPLADGLVTVSVPANVAQDAAVNGNTASAVLSRTFNATRPTLALSTIATNPTNAAFEVNFTFSKEVSGFEVGDIAVSNGAAAAFMQVSAQVYTARITPSAEGEVMVRVAENMAQDAAGNGNTAATALKLTIDKTQPTVELASGAPEKLNAAFEVTVTFSETVTGFTAADVTVVNGTVTAFAAKGDKEYTLQITPQANGEVRLSIAAGVAQDAAGNLNLASEQLIRLYDTTRPAVAVATAITSPVNTAFTARFTFSESVESFDLNNITVANGSVSNLIKESATVYTALVTPSANGVVTVSVAENVTRDAFGNGNLASNQLQVSYDVTQPALVLSTTAADVVNGPFEVTFTFSKAVTGFELQDIAVTNGATSAFTQVSAQVYTALVTPLADGEVGIAVAADVARDAAGNGNLKADALTRMYDATKPTLVLSTEAISPINAAFEVEFTFSEQVSGLALADVAVTGGTVSNLAPAAGGKVYTATITPSAEGEVSVSVAADVAEDRAGNGNLASNTLRLQYDKTRPAVTLATTAPALTNAAIPVTIAFSEAVSGFELADITVTNGTAADLTKISETRYSALVTPAADGEVSIVLAENKVADAATNGNTASNKLTLTYDVTAPASYAIAWSADRVDVSNLEDMALLLTGAEPGTTYTYRITSAQENTEVSGTGEVTEESLRIGNLNLEKLQDGTLTVQLYLTDKAGNKGAEVTAQVVKITRNIASVATPAMIQVPIRTKFEQVPLPATVAVTYSTDETAQVKVRWEAGAYDGTKAGPYVLTGILELAEMSTNLDNLTAKVTVEVQPNKVPTALAFSATTFKPDATAADVIGTLTTTDPDDTEFVYALVSGEGDTHNALFEIRGDQVYLKSNNGLSGMTSFTIRVRSTDPYLNTIERTFTLTKQAYDRTVDQLKIVNAFSPNGDGINDNWTIPELRFYNQVYIQVFDRSGVRVFETSDPEKGWDGRGPNGQILKGAFLFTVEVKDINWVKRGVVTILSK